MKLMPMKNRDASSKMKNIEKKKKRIMILQFRTFLLQLQQEVTGQLRYE